MNKYLLFVTCLLLMVSPLNAQTTQTARVAKSMTIMHDVMRQLDINYKDTLNYEQLIETAINSMLRQVDPYTVYIPKKNDTELKMMTTGKYGGIGAVIMQRDSNAYIMEPYQGMPAQMNDIIAGDKIISVDGFDCHKATTKEVSEHLRGVPGSIVKIKLEREGISKPFIREVERKEIHLPAVNYSTVLPDGKTGYILFSEFTTGSAQEFASEVDKLMQNSHIQGLVIDLRSNGGGIIDEAIQILSYFLDKGTEVVTTKGKIDGSCRSYITRTNPLWKDLPLVVMVDKQTASASEIVSGALQDLHRATIIGQRTFGKGLVQSIRPICYDGHLKVTTASYYLPSGRCIQAIDYSERQKGNELKKDTAGGILPDIVLNDSEKVDITYALENKHLFFDYANRYRRTHDSIADLDQFHLEDKDLDDFIEFLADKKFTYETETGRYLKQLMDLANHEDLEPNTKLLLDSVNTLLKPSYKEAVLRNKDRVKLLLEAEIAERYYFQQGRIAVLIRDDKTLNKAVEVLEQKHNQQ